MENTLFTNDNLFILSGLNSEIADLIYLDPPFNSKRTYSAPIGSKSAGASFKDIWTQADVNEAYLDKLVEQYPALVDFINSIELVHSKAMKAYVTYLTQRMIELYRVLKPTGSIYLHCDPTASHYLKQMMDAIFGKNNFRNEISWRRATSQQKGSQYKAKTWGNNTDIILFYTKSDQYSFHPLRELEEEEITTKFPLTDEHGRKYNTNTPLYRAPSMEARPNLCYEWRGFTNLHASGWRLSKERLEEEYQKGNIVIKPNGKLERRKYMEDYEGVPLGNLWLDINPAQGAERTGYPTQKPLALLERILQASSKQGDLVLDPFCGCATTCVAAQGLGRKWIGIDIEEKAIEVLVDRLEKGGYINDTLKFHTKGIDFIHRTDVPQRTDIPQVLASDKTVKERLYHTQQGHCKACDVEMRIVDFEVDHIIPKAKGGGDYYENYQLLCASCNRIKGDRPMEYLRTKIKTREKYIKKIQFGE